ncbi:MAG: acetylglutamate kinase [Halobacteriota archaeon]
MTTRAEMLTQTEFTLRLAMRKLWEDHVIWGRCYIISVAADLRDRNATVRRVRTNHEDIGDALKPFYGEGVTNTLKVLLLEHTNRAAPVIKALKARNSLLAKDAEQRWYENADQLCTFLSSINPYWPEKETQRLFYEHLRLSRNEAVHRFSDDFAGDIAQFDEAVLQIIELADLFSDGIVLQFRDRFGR